MMDAPFKRFFIPLGPSDPRLADFRRLVYVSGRRFRLFLLNRGKVVRSYKICLAKKGLGGLRGSGKTPLGWHRIFAKFGKGAKAGTVFKDRVNTREIWDGKSQFGDLILSRILWLEGLEPGRNKGGDRDTRARYIYIHGTNHVNRVGKPGSQGCVTMKSTDVIDLFDRVRKGDPIVVARR